MTINNLKIIYISILLVLVQPMYADVIIGNGNIERLNDSVVKDINCQNYTISVGGLLDTSNGGVLREVTTFEINGEWDYGIGQIKELGAWINNGTVAIKPTQTGTNPNLKFTTLCGPISVLGSSDTDGDGISDADEGDNAVALGHGITLDQDGDGVYNFLDLDSDNDGLLDTDEGGNNVDTDGDGIPDYLDALDTISSITITKVGTFNDENGDGYANINETISYEFNVTNTGNTTLTDVNLTDSNADITGSTTIAVLLAGESNLVAFKAIHTLTLQDIIDAKVENQAEVRANDSVGNVVNAVSDDPLNPVSEHDVTVTRFDIKSPEAKDIEAYGLTGDSVELDIMKQAKDGFFELNASSVRLIDPNTGDRVTTLRVAGEGVWVVDTHTGIISFMPEQGYIGDPTVVEYSVKDTQGTEVSASLYVDYPPRSFNDTISANASNSIIIHILDNDKKTSQPFDPASIVITDEDGKVIGTDSLGKELVVEDEGVWTVNDDGTLTFEADDGFTGNPTPIYYKLQDINGDFTNVSKVTLMCIQSNCRSNCTPTCTSCSSKPTPPVVPPIKPPVKPPEQATIYVEQGIATTIDVLGTRAECQGEDVSIFIVGGEGQVHGVAYVNDDETQVIYEAYFTTSDVTDYFVYQISGGTCDEKRVRVDVNINGCDDEVQSDNVSTYSVYNLFMIMFMTTGLGLYFVRKEEELSSSE